MNFDDYPREKKPSLRKRARRCCDAAAKIFAFFSLTCIFGLKYNLKFWLATGVILFLCSMLSIFISTLLDPYDTFDEYEDEEDIFNKIRRDI